MRKIPSLCLLPFLCAVACKEKSASPDAGAKAGAEAAGELRTQIEAPPLPPAARPPEPPAPEAIAPRVHPGPTKGAGSPEGLARALVGALKARSIDAFVDLTVSGRDIGLRFHRGLQVAMRARVGALARKFDERVRELGGDAEFVAFQKGLLLDFQRGQGAIETMPGYLDAKVRVKSGTGLKEIALGQIVKIEGRWKILDL